jgi:queuine/archaeosine tRNA-ribosyltransferase
MKGIREAIENGTFQAFRKAFYDLRSGEPA